MTAAQFRVLHQIDKKASIRDYLTPGQIKCITDLQRANTTFIQLCLPYEERKAKLMQLYKRHHIMQLFDEQQRLVA